MKRTLLFLMSILPLTTIMAQSNDRFPENVVIKVETTGVNTVQSDFGPEFVGNELWFSALNEEGVTRGDKEKSQNLFYHLYSVPLDQAGNITGSKKVILPEISHGYHAGPVSYCSATGEIFVTRSNYENREIKNIVFQKTNIVLRIDILKKTGNTWSLTEELPFNNPSWSTGHPAVSPTGDTLIFASNIPDKGMGGTDLYMTVRENGKWGEMINLGENINTEGDEMFPFFQKGKVLFFASDGITGGMGGHDIYYAYLTPDGFTSPKNLEELNASNDDFGLVIHPNGKVGYFTSQKAGGKGHDDIYKVIFEEEEEEEGEFELELLVRDKKSLDPVANARVVFNDNQTFYTGNDGVIRRELEKNTRYTATSDVEKYMNESVAFSTSGKPYGTLKEVIEIEKVEVGQKFVMENIYYEFDKWNILPESEIELNKLVKVLKDNPSWKVELGSHTDCRGSDAYNETLSRKRSESAVEYIVSRGISADRITAKGYGETQLVNECDDGVPCSEEEHRMNRRTEFKILEMD